ncbi:hypothetical protein J5U23_02260 [Saccharolobus shibatae B12]|uniref:AMP-binding enzyme C-terminal domain-containing protein n=1 Tax=Saccharolobus shibatae (strain ATCC 51178 / DSM 5389 / JCM 8931 / NBRC 15437 / B12) TaxID=523848 RepID=A0A8F5BQ37_SACSH|nr:hypothetical protein [Saccharolobus shibatae]QXJ29391.1 hypothetical protein J5U23_02260 [Saccharolobus shibatae B12]
MIKIIDENGRDSKFGGIIIKSPDLVGGYFNNLAETEKRLLGIVGFIMLKWKLLRNGFMHLGEYMIKVYGLSVSPGFLVYVSLRYPAIEKVWVTDISDAEKDDVLIAFVKLRSSVNHEDLLEWYKKNIVLSSLPLTESGKVRREELKRLYKEAYRQK